MLQGLPYHIPWVQQSTFPPVVSGLSFYLYHVAFFRRLGVFSQIMMSQAIIHPSYVLMFILLFCSIRYWDKFWEPYLMFCFVLFCFLPLHSTVRFLCGLFIICPRHLEMSCALGKLELQWWRHALLYTLWLTSLLWNLLCLILIYSLYHSWVGNVWLSLPNLTITFF